MIDVFLRLFERVCEKREQRRDSTSQRTHSKLFHRHCFDITGCEKNLLARVTRLKWTEVHRIVIDRLSHRCSPLMLFQSMTIGQNGIGRRRCCFPDVLRRSTRSIG